MEIGSRKQYGPTSQGFRLDVRHRRNAGVSVSVRAKPDLSARTGRPTDKPLVVREYRGRTDGCPTRRVFGLARHAIDSIARPASSSIRTECETTFEPVAEKLDERSPTRANQNRGLWMVSLLAAQAARRYAACAVILLSLQASVATTAVAQQPSGSSDLDAARQNASKVCNDWKVVGRLEVDGLVDSFNERLRDYKRRDGRAEQVDSALRCLSARLVELNERAQALSQGSGIDLGPLQTELEGIRRAVDRLQPTGSSSAGGEAATRSQLKQILEVLRETYAIDQAILVRTRCGAADPRPAECPTESPPPQEATPASPIGTENQARSQADPTTSVSSLLGDPLPGTTQITYGLAVVPDPRVPRHRRSYDNAVSAIIQGMLQAQYVLEMYAFPWQADLQSGKLEGGFAVSDERYGLMVFRRDAWRYDNIAGRDLRRQVSALYIVPETGAYGAQRGALLAAMKKIREQRSEIGGLHDQGLVKTTTGCEWGDEAITLHGPTFSGSLDSLLRSADGSCGSAIHARSSSATAYTNEKVDDLGSSLQFEPLAINDEKKLRFLQALRDRLGVKGKPIAIFYETSVFGLDICRDTSGGSAPEICADRDLTLVPFPANIADIRFGMRAKLREKRVKMIDPLLRDSRHLELQDEAENGNEFPDSYQSPLTAVANQLDLDAAISRVKNRKPSIVVVVATDTRDRLFLFSELRTQLQNVLLVDMETDRLLAHPDYIGVSRGAFTLASSELESWLKRSATSNDSSELSITNTWSTDRQALLAYSICSAQALAANPCPVPSTDLTSESRVVHLHVVTRSGLKSASQVNEECGQSWRCSGLLPDWLAFYSAAAGLVTTVLWASRRFRSRSRLLRCLDARALTFVLLVIPLFFVRGNAFCVSVFICALEISGLWYLFRAYVDFSGSMEDGAVAAASEPIRARWNWRFLPVWFVGQLVVLAGLSFWQVLSLHLAGADTELRLVELRRALTSDASAGLAYGLAVTVAAAVSLYAFAASHTYVTVAQRNRFVGGLEDQPSSQGKPGRDEGGKSRLRKMGVALEGVRLKFGDCKWTIAGFLGAAVIVWLVTTSLQNGIRVTVFGRASAIVAYAALISVTVVTAVMFVAALYVASRVRLICRKVEHVLMPAKGDSDRLFDWKGLAGEKPNFSMTPILAVPGREDDCVKTMTHTVASWKASLEGLGRQSAVTPNEVRRLGGIALFALVASSMTIYRWCVLGCAASALASATIIYLFPVMDADSLLLLNIAFLLAIGVHSGFSTVRYEANELLSNVMSNRPKAMQFSLPLFGFVAFPFVMLVIAIAITQIPGVLTWGDGIFDLLIQLTRPDILKGD